MVWGIFFLERLSCAPRGVQYVAPQFSEPLRLEERQHPILVKNILTEPDTELYYEYLGMGAGLLAEEGINWKLTDHICRSL